MNNLVIMKDQQAVTSSLQVAESFGKQHKNVIQTIEDKMSTAENSALLNMFSEGTYKASNGKQNKMYYMNRDGFTFIAMGFTGAKADTFKLKYIEAFNQLENEHKQHQIDTEELSPELKMFNQTFKSVANQELENKKLNHKVDNIAEIVSLNTTDWRKTSQSIIRLISWM